MKKKVLLLLFAAACQLCLAACGKRDVAAEDPGETAIEENAAGTEEPDPGANGASESAEGNTTGTEEPDSSPQPYVQPEMKGEITVTVYQSSEWLEMAAQMFEEKYPDMKVNIDAFDTQAGDSGEEMMSTRPAGQTREDYVAWLNTHLVTGDVGDIVSTSEGLAVGKYAGMGVFEDLAPYLESAEEINEDGYYMNIFDAHREESGEMYLFPVSAAASPLIVFGREIVDETGLLPKTEGVSMTWREALDLAEEMYDASRLPDIGFPNPQSILYNIFTKEVITSVNYAEEKVELRKQELLDVLNAFEEFDNYNSYSYNEGAVKVFDLSYQEDLGVADFVASGYYEAVQWKQSDGKVYLSPYFKQDYGMNSRSKNKALAWEFLKFLLSDEVQTLPAFPNASINKNGLRARVENYCEAWELSEERGEEILRLTDGWLSQVNAYRPEDTDLIQLGDSIMAEFLNGRLTAEEAVSEAEFRLEQYLSE